jgi:hypothetical protein
MKIGILAFGSLIDDPGKEIANVISGDSITVETPFPVEYGRFSLSRGRAPTVVPHASGGEVTARILPLASGCSDKFARDILYRREVYSKDQSREYQRRDGRNDILVETLLNFQGFDMVFYTDFNAEGKCFDLTAGKLASAAI